MADKLLFHVQMDVHRPRDITSDAWTKLVGNERDMAQRLQQAGTWRHLWRLVGQYKNFSIFAVESNSELHEILSSLPLFPYMTVTVTPICRHPSSIHEDDR